MEGNRPSYPVVARVAADFVPFLRRHFGKGLGEAPAAAGPPDADGRITLTLPFETLYEARAQILSFDCVPIRDIAYRQTDHFRVYRDFIAEECRTASESWSPERPPRDDGATRGTDPL